MVLLFISGFLLVLFIRVFLFKFEVFGEFLFLFLVLKRWFFSRVIDFEYLLILLCKEFVLVKLFRFSCMFEFLVLFLEFLG